MSHKIRINQDIYYQDGWFLCRCPNCSGKRSRGYGNQETEDYCEIPLAVQADIPMTEPASKAKLWRGKCRCGVFVEANLQGIFSIEDGVTNWGKRAWRKSL